MARRPKTLTREQLQARKDKAVRFTRDVAGDSDRAKEIDAESVDDYSERRKIHLSNPRRSTLMPRKTLDDYRDEVKELKDQIRDLEDQNATLNEKLDSIADVIEPEDDEEADDEDDEGDTGGDDDFDDGAVV